LLDLPVTDFSKSALYVAQYHFQYGGGNLKLAKQYLETLSSSNAEDVNTAQEMLKQVKLAMSEEALSAASRKPTIPTGDSMTES
jgi:anaphase-promoting complex subunit 8